MWLHSATKIFKIYLYSIVKFFKVFAPSALEHVLIGLLVSWVSALRSTGEILTMKCGDAGAIAGMGDGGGQPGAVAVRRGSVILACDPMRVGARAAIWQASSTSEVTGWEPSESPLNWVVENLVDPYRRTHTIGFGCKFGRSEGSNFSEF